MGPRDRRGLGDETKTLKKHSYECMDSNTDHVESQMNPEHSHYSVASQIVENQAGALLQVMTASLCHYQRNFPHHRDAGLAADRNVGLAQIGVWFPSSVTVVLCSQGSSATASLVTPFG